MEMIYLDVTVKIFKVKFIILQILHASKGMWVYYVKLVILKEKFDKIHILILVL